MTDAQVTLWLVAIGVFEAFSLIMFSMFMLGRKALALQPLLKTGLVLLAFGLVVQLFRSAYYLQFGTYPVDRYIPWWALKDAGGSLILCYFTFTQSKG